MAPAEQREQLIRAFIQEDTIGPELGRNPSEEEVSSILQPWRAQEIRAIAKEYNERDPYGCYFILRTYYGGGEGDGAKLREWLDQDPSQGFEIAERDRSWQVLDNAALFDVCGGDHGENWQRVYHVLPELAVPGRDRRQPSDFDYVREMATMHNDDPEDEDLEFWILTMAITGNWLIVADRHAFENDELRLVFRDNKGNVVRESRIRPDELGELSLRRLRGSLHESEYWLDGEVGEDYQTGGQIMRELLHRARQYITP